MNSPPDTLPADLGLTCERNARNHPFRAKFIYHSYAPRRYNNIGHGADSTKPSLRYPPDQRFSRRQSGDGAIRMVSSNEFLAWKEFIFMGRAFREEHFKTTVSVARG